MSTHELKRRRGTTEEHKYFRGAVGELTVDTDKNTVVVHDGITYGGHPLVTQRDLIEFLGKEYFINLNDLSEDLKKKLEKTIDEDYINSLYRRLDTKITDEDIDDEIIQNIRLIIELEKEFTQFLEDIKSSSLSLENKKYGADLVGFCIYNNRFSKDVLTVQDALDELAVRIYNEEYNTTKLNKIMTEFSGILDKYKKTLDTYDSIFLRYNNNLNDFETESFNPLKAQVETNARNISYLETSINDKVINEVSEKLGTTAAMWTTIQKLMEFINQETNIETVIISFYAQLDEKISKINTQITNIKEDITQINDTIERTMPIYGSGTFNSTKGYVIYHYLNTLNYNVNITPTSNPNGKLGEIWVEKTKRDCKVYCSGSTTLTTFDYLITQSDRFQLEVINNEY